MTCIQNQIFHNAFSILKFSSDAKEYNPHI